VPALTTIGVYEFDADSFLATLRDAEVTLVVDVRQRRGVRGPRYAWANARRLQGLLADAGIAYAHHRELAPSTELRHLQYRDDDLQGVGKRTRQRLSPEYVARYTAEVLDPAPLSALVRELPADGISALLCVEALPEACHRSLIAARLAQRFGIPVRHLLPG